MSVWYMMVLHFPCQNTTFLANNIKLFAGLVSMCAVSVVILTWRSSNIYNTFLITEKVMLIQVAATEHINTAGVERKAVAAKSWTGLFIGESHLRYIQDLNITSHDKWIIVDVTAGCSDRRFFVPPGWRIVLVAGKVMKTQGCSPPSCISLPSPLSELDQASSLNAEKEGRQRMILRNLAYLTVISSGADAILEIDCSVSLAVAVVLLWPPPGRDSGLMYSETLLFNPYKHFGAWAGVPDAVGADSVNSSRIYYIREFDNVVVRHGVSSSSPDISHVSGSTSGGFGSADGSGRTFDSSVPPVFVGRRSFSPVAPACSLYLQSSFWSLLFPCFSPELRCRLLRQVVQQRLFRELDAFSAYFQVPGGPSHHDDLSALQSVDALSTRIGASTKDPERPGKTGSFVSVKELVEALDAWTCDPKLTVFGCLENIGDYLSREGLIDHTENTLIKSWVVAMRGTSATEPVRVSKPWRGVRKLTETQVVLGHLNSRLSAGGSREEEFLQEKFVKPIQTVCGKADTKEKLFSVAQWRRPLIKDIVLIVTFNSNTYFFANLPALETMHRPFFRHIVYCTPNLTEVLENPAHREYLDHVTVVEGYSDGWFLFYECMVSVAQMNIQGVRGYLQMGDDTLLNTWTIRNMPKTAVWKHGIVHISSVHLHETFPGWVWWGSTKGQLPWLRTFARLEELSGLSTEDILLPARADRALYKRLSPDQTDGLDRQLNRSQALPQPVETFSQVYERIADQRQKSYKLDGSKDWTEASQDIAQRFVKSYYQDNNMAGLVEKAGFDIFYVPQSKIKDFVTIARHFMRNHVMAELAMPAILYGLAGRNGLNLIKGSELWEGGSRSNPHKYYNATDLFLHPFKLGPSLKKEETRAMFCNVHLNNLISMLEENEKL